jgi:hypothetical protein
MLPLHGRRLVPGFVPSTALTSCIRTAWSKASCRDAEPRGGERRRCRRCPVVVNRQHHLALLGRRPVGVLASPAGERCRCRRSRPQQPHGVLPGRRPVGVVPGFAGERRRFHSSRAHAPACVLSAALTGGVMQCCLVGGWLLRCRAAPEKTPLSSPVSVGTGMACRVLC